ncbi:hypothetical protein BGZ97_000856 [Linnemannia gamsii]|uniref:Uncharacterized protein n=1 Tax=Linnemannia gamsii TaxID=64522 RepID=A0A9P6UJZ1_9FUNG|nr:hypothetical protein BGZ97_000856 [Linnemannia gamsii]
MTYQVTKTTPIQEPYFQTRHTIASQHTLSTLGGILFSLDEVPTEFNQDMYIAMRNRIFELEAKSVNYSPFSHSRKRSFERNGLDDYPDRYAYGYDLDAGHYSKRPAHRYLSHGHPDQGPPPQTPYRQSTSHPSWYTPEVYSARPRYPPHHGRPPLDRERDHHHPGEGPYYDNDHGTGSRPVCTQSTSCFGAVKTATSLKSTSTPFPSAPVCAPTAGSAATAATAATTAFDQ